MIEHHDGCVGKNLPARPTGADDSWRFWYYHVGGAHVGPLSLKTTLAYLTRLRTNSSRMIRMFPLWIHPLTVEFPET